MADPAVEELRERVATACRILARAGLVEGILGHVSARVGEDRMLIRCRGPRERGLAATTAEDVRLVDLDGRGDELTEGWRAPNELAIHAGLYRARPDAGAVVHAHPPAALVAGLAELELRPVFGAFNIPAMRLAREGVPVYPRSVLITRPELAAELVRCMDGASTCLMRGHGITTVGATVQQATVRALDLNALAEVTRELAALGAEPPPLGEADLAELPDLGSAFNDEMTWRAHVAALPGGHGDRGARRRLPLTLAINDYDHVRDLVSGAVPVQGVELTCLSLSVEEIFFRFARFREWDVSEMSLAKFVALRAAGEPLIAIPVFPSRAFRHSAIFVRPDGPVDDPASLAGARIGIPEWTQTASVYARGLLEHEYGVDLGGVQWVQAGTNEPGRIEGIDLELPPRFAIAHAPEHTLNDMLVAGELDAVIAAHPPRDFTRRTGRIVRLFSDYRAVEEAHYRRTGIFPIMHLIALRGDVHDAHPWVAMNLFEAFDEARRRGVARVTDPNTPRFAVAWAFAHAEHVESVMGGDLWPYGLDANRTTLDAFLAYAHEQGVTGRRLAPEELFAPQTTERFRV